MSELERLRALNAELYAALEYIFEHIADKERGPRDLYPAFGLDGQRALKMAAVALAKAREPLSAWSDYRPDSLTDDELAEYVIQSRGVLIP